MCMATGRGFTPRRDSSTFFLHNEAPETRVFATGATADRLFVGIKGRLRRNSFQFEVTLTSIFNREIAEKKIFSLTFRLRRAAPPKKVLSRRSLESSN